MSRHDASPTTDQVPSSLRVAGSVAVGAAASPAKSKSWTSCAVGGRTEQIVEDARQLHPGEGGQGAGRAELGDQQLLGQQLLDRWSVHTDRMQREVAGQLGVQRD